MASVVARAPSRGIWTADDDTAGLLGRPVMARPPIKLMLSLIESCNLRCFHCLGASTARPDRMSGRTASRELVDFIVERILPETRSLRLGGLGNTEQLLAPELEYFLERVAARPPVDCFDLTTNLSVMTPRRAALIVRTVTELNVSLEGVGANFEAARGMPWEKFEKNLRMIADARRHDPASRMRLHLLVCLVPRFMDDLLQIPLFKTLGVDRILLRELDAFAPEHVGDALWRHPFRTIRFLREFKRAAAAHGMEFATEGLEQKYLPLARGRKLFQPLRAISLALGLDRPEYRTCALPFETLTITADGHFGVCCLLPRLRELRDAPAGLDVMEVWNSAPFEALRREVNGPTPGPVCAACPQKSTGTNAFKWLRHPERLARLFGVARSVGSRAVERVARRLGLAVPRRRASRKQRVRLPIVNQPGDRA